MVPYFVNGGWKKAALPPGFSFARQPIQRHALLEGLKKGKLGSAEYPKAFAAAFQGG